MLKTWVQRGKHKGPVNPQLIKGAQEATLQKDFVTLIKARQEYVCACSEGGHSTDSASLFRRRQSEDGATELVAKDLARHSRHADKNMYLCLRNSVD